MGKRTDKRHNCFSPMLLVPLKAFPVVMENAMEKKRNGADDSFFPFGPP
jgi:hypothetical protein